jgi:hypothetical protein
MKRTKRQYSRSGGGAASSAHSSNLPLRPSKVQKTEKQVSSSEEDSDGDDEERPGMTSEEIKQKMEREARRAAKSLGATDVEVEATDEERKTSPDKLWARVRELDGWEKEERFRWYRVKDDKNLNAWTVLAKRLAPFNEKARQTLLKDAVEGLANDIKSQNVSRDPEYRVMMRMMEVMMGGFTMHSHPNVLSSEYHIQIFTNAQKQTLGAASLIEHKEWSEEVPEGMRHNNLHAIEETRATRAKDMWLYRQWFFKIGMDSSWNKHCDVNKAPALELLTKLAAVNSKDDDICKAFHKGVEI